MGEQTYTITHIDPGFYLLGYIARDGRVYLADKDVNVVSYALSLAVVEYQTVVLRGDIDAADEMLAYCSCRPNAQDCAILRGTRYTN